MKKLSKFFVILFCLLGLTSCGNVDIGFGNFSFNGIHVFFANKDYELVSWRDTKLGVEVKLLDDNVLFLSEGTYMLYSNYCPICNINKGEN